MVRREVYILAIPKAQEIIMDFLKDNFRQDQISLVENILKICPVHILDEQAMKEINSHEKNKDEIYDRMYIGAYASKEGIFIPDEYTHYNSDEEFSEDVALSTIIHEYAHRLRSANSQYGWMLEEGFATIFAEACIFHYRIKEQMKDGQTITQPGIYTKTDFKYQKAENQIRAILYVLNQKGMDIDLIGEYIFGNQDVFKQKCIQIFGEEFSRYFDLANSPDDQYYNDYTIQEENSEILLTNILKDYICKNGLDLKKYWETNSLFLYKTVSGTLMKSIVAAGETSFKESDKKEYKLCEYSAKLFMDDEQSERESRITRIRKIAEERYNISGKSREEIYSILETLCSDYIQGRNLGTKENLILNDEIHRIFPKIDEFIEKFIKLRGYTMSSAILENLELENVSYSSIDEYISRQLIIKRVENIFENCTSREDLMDKVYELQHYEQIMDLNQILPNYTDFVQFINEMKQQIPNEFSKEQKWNYKTIYDKILNLYTTKKMQELTQSKSKEKEYKAVAEHILKQYKLVTNEEKFNEINEIDIKLNSRLSSKQQEKEKESNNKLKINENKQTLESEKNNLLKRNVIIKFFKRRQIKKLTAEITELEQSIQNSDLVLDKLTAEITELNNKIKSNKEELVKSCGINLSDYRTIMMQCKEENLTKEKLIEKYKNIQLMIDSLNIQEKEQYLISLCERNGLEMKSFEEQQLTWSER